MRSVIAVAVLAAGAVGCGGGAKKDEQTNPEFVAPTYEPAGRGEPGGGVKGGKKP